MALFLSGLSLGAALVNVAYGIFFLWESREKRKSGEDGPYNGSNG